MAIDSIDLGFLGFGAPPQRFFGTVSNSPDNGDESGFEVGSLESNLNIAIFPSGRLNNGDADLRLFTDLDGDRRLDVPGEFVLQQNIQTNGSVSEAINFRPNGVADFIAGVVNSRARAPFGIVDYSILIARVAPGTANPLANQEIQLGTIDKDLKRSNSVNNNDTADNFAFSLDANDSLKIGVRELGSQKGNVTARVVQDDNGNGIVDQGEIVARGISSSNGNIDTISGIKGAGDYILQVCQQAGSTNFQVNFDHSAIGVGVTPVSWLE